MGIRKFLIAAVIAIIVLSFAFAQPGGITVTSKTHIVLIDYPKTFPKKVALKLWIYNYSKGTWQDFNFTNRVKNDFMEPVGDRGFRLNFKKLGYADGNYGVLVQVPGKAKPVSKDAIVVTALFDTVPPKIEASIRNRANYYRGGEKIKVDLKYSEAFSKADGLKVEIQSGGSGNWETLIPGTSPNVKTVEVPLPARSSKLNKLRITVTDAVGHSDTSETKEFGIDADAPILKVMNVEIDRSDPASARVFIRWEAREELKLTDVQLYVTNDGGATWTVSASRKNPDPAQPFSFVAPAGGTYGFRLVGRDLVGNTAGRPEPGSKPDPASIIPITPTIQRLGENHKPAEDLGMGRDEDGVFFTYKIPLDLMGDRKKPVIFAGLWAKPENRPWERMGNTSSIGEPLRYTGQDGKVGIMVVLHLNRTRFELREDDYATDTFTIDTQGPEILEFDIQRETAGQLIFDPQTKHDILWDVKDPNLSAKPVELFYMFREKAGRREMPIGTNPYPTKGKLGWTIPSVPGEQFWLKIVARDEVRNKAEKYSNATEKIIGPFYSTTTVNPIVGPELSASHKVGIVTHPRAKNVPEPDIIEIWFRPAGGKWEKKTFPAITDPPYPVTFKKDGKYELAYSIISRGGSSKEPDKAHIVLLVDTVTPELTFRSPLVRKDGDYVGSRRALTPEILWSCKDDNLGAKPIRIEFSRDGGKKWVYLKDSAGSTYLGNSGRYIWSRIPQEDLRDCAVRITAADLVGNTRVIKTPAFRIDSKVPTARFTSREPGNTYRLSFVAKDLGGSGIRDVRLYMNPPGDRNWVLVQTGDPTWDAARPGYGTFSFPIPKKIGMTGFYLVPRDGAGNTRAIPVTTSQHAPDCAFYIEPLKQPYTFRAPFDGSTSVRGGIPHTVLWYRPIHHSNALVSIAYYNGQSWRPLIKGRKNTGDARINIPKDSTTGCKLRITAAGQGIEGGKIIKESRAFTVDSTAPEILPGVTSRLGTPRICTNSRNAVIPYRATDTLNPVAKVFVYWRTAGKLNEPPRAAQLDGFPFTDEQEVTVPFFSDGDLEIFLGAEDRVGNRMPAPTTTSDPQLRLTIDTVKPQIVEFLSPDQQPEYKPGERIRLKVKYWDESGEFNRSETVLQFARVDSEKWTTIKTDVKPDEEYDFIAPPEPGEYYIRLTVSDICHNKAERSIRVAVDIGRRDVQIVFTLPKTLLVGGEEISIPYEVTKLRVERPVTFQYRERVTADWEEISSRLVETGTFQWKAPAKIDTEKAQIRIVVRNRLGEPTASTPQTFAIDSAPPEVAPDLRGAGRELVKKSGPVRIPVIPTAEVGPAKIKTIEFWVSEDTGRSWQLAGSIDSVNDTFIFDRDEEGRYFFITRAIDQLGRSAVRVPQPFDPDQARLYIDKTPPRLSDVRVGRGYGPNRYFPAWEPIPISWAYHDERPKPLPITIEYSSDAGTTWKLVATNVPNIGHFNWRVQTEGGEELPAHNFYRIRVTGVDLAGNEKSAMSPLIGIVTKGPEAMVVKPQLGVEWFSKSTNTLLPIYVKGSERIPITNLVLFYRPLGEPKWQKYPRTFAPGTSQIPFEMGAGTYELLLKAVFSTTRRHIPGAGATIAPPRDVEQQQAQITIDPTAPEIKITSGFARKEFRKGEVEDLRWEAEDEYLDSIYLELSEDGGATWNRILGNQNFIADHIVGIPLYYATGRFYKLRIVARDKAGNRTYDSTGVFSIDGSPPVVEVYAKQKLTEARTFRFKIRPIGDVSDLARIDLYVRRHGETWKLVQSFKSLDEPIIYTAPKYGRYSIIAVGIDRLGNTEHAPLQNDPGELEFRETRWLKISFRGFEEEQREVFRGGKGYRVDWTCAETDLTPSPISFEYKTSATGEWLKIPGQEFANLGWADLVLPKIDEKRVWLRIHVTDTQDSTGWDELPDPIEIRSTPPEPIEKITVRRRYRPEQEGFEEPVEGEERTEGEGGKEPEKEGKQPKQPRKAEENYLARGNELLEKGFYDEARKMFMLAIQRKQRLGDAYYGLGRAHLRLKSESSTVIHYFERALEFAPNFAPCLSDLGTVYFDLGSFAKAAGYFEKAARLNPSPVYSANLGKAYYHLRKYSEADTAFDGTLRADPKYWEAYWYKALIRNRKGDTHGERDMWNKVLELIDPDSEWGRKAQRLLRDVEDKIKKS